MVVQSFTEAYNTRRHEQVQSWPEPRGRPSEVPRPAAEAPSRMPRSSLPQQSTRASRQGGYAYKLVRSDLDDEHLHKKQDTLPGMPKHDFGMKQRTKEFFELEENEENKNERCAFIETDLFQGISGAVIFGNAILIGLETDIQSPAWIVLEHLLLSYFVFELACRLIHHRLMYFRHEDDWTWNWFDFFIVASGVFDQWLIPLLNQFNVLQEQGHGEKSGGEEAGGGKMSVFFMLMRMLRLLRIVRLFRLVRIVRPLYELAQGVLEALQGMFWVLVFLLMTLYTMAILCTRVIGSGDIIPEDMQDDEALQDIVVMFATVQDSMFTLFGTMSSWSLLKFVPLFDDMPMLKPMFVVFYVYSAWALLAVMTGVVSENMIAIREQMVKEDEAREEIRRSTITKTLIELFQDSDTDHSGTVSKQEFEVMMSSRDLIDKVERNTHMKKRDLQDLFEWIDHDGSGTITIDEFMQGFKWVNEPLRAKLLVRLQERLAKDMANLNAAVTENFEKRFGEVLLLIAAPLKKVHAITEQMQTLDDHFSALRGRLKDQTQVMPSFAELQAVEQRLTGKMGTILARIKQIEKNALKKEKEAKKATQA